MLIRHVHVPSASIRVVSQKQARAHLNAAQSNARSCMHPNAAMNSSRRPSSSGASTHSCSWHSLGLRNDVANAAIEQLHLDEPTEIQATAVSNVLTGANTLVASHTGSGKTLAYLLPIASLLKSKEESFGAPTFAPRALVLAPTKELASQVLSQAKALSHAVKLASTGAMGGMSARKQRSKLLSSRNDIVVGTPGRVMLHARNGSLSLSRIEHLVLDEADTLLRGGFDDQDNLLSALNNRDRSSHKRSAELQSVFVAATVSQTMEKQLKQKLQLDTSALLRAQTSSLHTLPEQCSHRFLEVSGDVDKLEWLAREASKRQRNERVMIFCNTVQSCRAVEHSLVENGIDTVHYHGEMPPERRSESYDRFASAVSVGTSTVAPIMVCTDVAARGLDFECNVDHIINFDFPKFTEDYIHRAGRTARAGRSGAVTSLVTKREAPLAKEIDRRISSGMSVDGADAASAAGGEASRRARAQERRKGKKTDPSKSKPLIRSGSQRASTQQQLKNAAGRRTKHKGNGKR